MLSNNLIYVLVDIEKPMGAIFHTETIHLDASCPRSLLMKHGGQLNKVLSAKSYQDFTTLAFAA